MLDLCLYYITMFDLCLIYACTITMFDLCLIYFLYAYEENIKYIFSVNS